MRDPEISTAEQTPSSVSTREINCLSNVKNIWQSQFLQKNGNQLHADTILQLLMIITVAHGKHGDFQHSISATLAISISRTVPPSQVTFRSHWQY
jgi:hypothetical protein